MPRASGTSPGYDTETYAGNWAVYGDQICYVYPGIGEDCQHALVQGSVCNQRRQCPACCDAGAASRACRTVDPDGQGGTSVRELAMGGSSMTRMWMTWPRRKGWRP